MLKIDFDNGLTGKEFRMYRFSSDPRQYYLSELKEIWEIETDKNGEEISRIRKTDKDGKPEFRESNKSSHKNIDHVKNAYTKREEYNNNVDTQDYDHWHQAMEALGNIIKQACITSLSIEETINAAINKK